MFLYKRMKRLRKSKKLTQRELASLAEVSQGFISLCEQGKQTPSLRTLGRIAESLDIPPQQLIDSRKKRRKHS